MPSFVASLVHFYKFMDDRTCRVCLEGEPNVALPCRCTGDLGMMHDECFRRWLQFLRRSGDPPVCELCRYEMPSTGFYELWLWSVNLVFIYCGFLILCVFSMMQPIGIRLFAVYFTVHVIMFIAFVVLYQRAASMRAQLLLQ